MKRPVNVAIIEQTANAKLCSESCGVNWLKTEPQKDAGERLRKLYGDSINIEFLDLDIPEVRQKHGGWLKRVKDENLLLPLLVINGEIRISGFFDTRMLLDMVDAEGELSRD